MKILEIEDQDNLKFNALALSHGTIFDTAEWTNIFGDSVIRYGIYDKGGNIIGGFMIYKEKRFGLSVYRDPPFTPYMGPFLKIDATNPVTVMDIWKKALSLIVELLEKLPFSVISLSLSNHVIDMQPFIWQKFKVIPRYTYILDLSLSIEEILMRMSNERRKNINKGVKDGLIVRKVDDFSIIRSLVLKTYLRQGKRFNQYYLNKILYEFAKNSNSFAFVTFQDERAIACSYCIYDKGTTYYLLGGYDNANKHHGAGTMSMLESIKYAKDMGLQYFDFEGSMNPKIEKYFRGFGGQLVPYYSINKARLPLEILLKLFQRDLF